MAEPTTNKEEFLAALQQLAKDFDGLVTATTGEWVVKGFIDIFKHIYTISADTKVVSKLIELMLFPHFTHFAKERALGMVLTREQNHYPDLTFIGQNGKKYAVDLKTTYRITDELVNTMTLGAFTGYFRERKSKKNITYPYCEYEGHYVLGVIYTRTEVLAEEAAVYTIEELDTIPSVIRDLQFFAQPKYRIAKDQPGSGNTKNIGAVSSLKAVINGEGPFTRLGEEVFDDYWMFYLTRDMARAAELDAPPYHNLESYLKYKKLPKA
jgi:hypothetical protein